MGDAIDALLERAARIQWLKPDGAMEQQSAEARSFLSERVDEHRAALAPHAPHGDDSLVARSTVLRSMYEAHFASNAVSSYFNCEPFSDAAVAWAGALDRARSSVLREVSSRLSPGQIAEVAERVWGAFRERYYVPRVERRANAFVTRRIERIRGLLDALIPVPGGEVWLLEALALAGGVTAARPWSPWIDLWERGVAPLASHNGVLLLYVPVRSNGAVLADPEGSIGFAPLDKDGPSYSGSRETDRLERRQNYSVFDGAKRIGKDEREPGKGRDKRVHWWATHKRFYRVGLGPLPGMHFERIEDTFDMVVSNSPYVKPSPLMTTLPRTPWTAQSALEWMREPASDHEMLARYTLDERSSNSA